MVTSIKLKNNYFIDSTGIVHNHKILADILYPVGSIYLSTNSTSPATLFGGTWTQIKDRFLYCTTTSKTTGGSTTTGSHTLTTNEIPSHSHDFTDTGRVLYWDAGLPSCGGLTSGSTVQYTWGSNTKATGGGQGHTHPQNLPPYFTVYCWYRTA